MEKQHFRARIAMSNEEYLKVALDVFFFEDDGYTIAYCPALDLSAAGLDLENAKAEFAQVFSEYAMDCIEQNTLSSDLIAHGWQLRERGYDSPSVTQLLIGNSTLRDILDNRCYSKQLVNINHIPSTSMAFA